MESFLVTTWNDKDGTIRGRTRTELLPTKYKMTGTKRTIHIQLKLTTTTKDTITFYIKNISTCKNRRGKCKVVVQWKLESITYTLYTNNDRFLTDLERCKNFCKITAVDYLF